MEVKDILHYNFCTFQCNVLIQKVSFSHCYGLGVTSSDPSITWMSTLGSYSGLLPFWDRLCYLPPDKGSLQPYSHNPSIISHLKKVVDIMPRYQML